MRAELITSKSVPAHEIDDGWVCGHDGHDDRAVRLGNELIVGDLATVGEIVRSERVRADIHPLSPQTQSLLRVADSKFATGWSRRRPRRVPGNSPARGA
jgi:hypothetical protein